MTGQVPEPSAFTAYYDTSGTADRDPFIVTVGLLGSNSRWDHFGRDWQLMLTDSAIPHVHMKDLAPNNPPYARFRNDEQGKRVLIQRMCELVTSHLGRAFVSTITVDSYNRWNGWFRLKETFGGANTFPIAGCAVEVNKWHNANNPGIPLRHIHEAGDDEIGRAISGLAQYDSITLLTAPKADPKGEWAAPFQAADFIAWEYRRAIKDSVKSGQDTVRGSFRHLRDIVELPGRIFNEASLLKICLGRPDLHRGNNSAPQPES